jgi:hypothetical protein
MSVDTAKLITTRRENKMNENENLVNGIKCELCGTEYLDNGWFNYCDETLECAIDNAQSVTKVTFLRVE